MTKAATIETNHRLPQPETATPQPDCKPPLAFADMLGVSA